MRDSVLSICRQLARIDNRPDADLADVCELSEQTIHRLRNGDDIAWVRSSTVSKLARGMRRVVVVKHKPQ